MVGPEKNRAESGGSATTGRSTGQCSSATAVPQKAAATAGGRWIPRWAIAEIEIAEEPAQAREDKNMLAGRATRC
jgi:hypothetical protein